MTTPGAESTYRAGEAVFGRRLQDCRMGSPPAIVTVFTTGVYTRAAY